MATMRLDIVTLFPEVMAPYLAASVLGRAREAGLVDLRLVQLRDFADDRHRTVDDTPYGGGKGMVLKVEPLHRAIASLRDEDSRVVLMTPRGRLFRQEDARRLAAERHLILVAGHYEGVDERVGRFVDEELSIGDYVLTGGELPALVVADAVIRLLPGVLPEGAAEEESFADGLLEYPHYTRPRVFLGLEVPEVLLSGDHAAIARWRRQERLRATLERRPDLLRGTRLTPEDRLLLRLWGRGREEVPDGGEDGGRDLLRRAENGAKGANHGERSEDP
jgi:tRNA (guanine37-N1)-methyltransferase